MAQRRVTLNYLQQLATARQQGQPLGIYSVCSAHHWVLEAAIQQAIADDSPLLIEATCNQVNHLGGYTGMTPEDFRKRVLEIAEREGFDTSRLFLGGDHLGPNPWQKLPAAEAMREAEKMVRAYVRAGFQKIHLDASMALGGETAPLSDEVIAHRAALLCAAAEQEAGEIKPVYVIGTEVPVPGGAAESLHGVEVTSREAAAKTLRVHKEIFAEAGLTSVWPRVIALVVQPGVEFDHTRVIDYQPAAATHLTQLLDEEEGIVYEAHSTDYQRPEAYQALVRDGFAILKVGPALTFAMREALLGLATIENELLGIENSSRVMQVLEEVMLNDRRNWENYYNGDQQTVQLLRRYSYSDRVRYYWNNADVCKAIDIMLKNLGSNPIPETLLSAFMPDEYLAVRKGLLSAEPNALIRHRVRQVLCPYAKACFPAACLV